MKKINRLAEIEKMLGNKKLYWLGSRGIDGQCLTNISQFNGAFSVISPMKLIESKCDISLEIIKKHRHDLDTYNPDEDYSNAVVVFSQLIKENLNSECVVIPYRPWKFFSSIYLTKIETVDCLGLLPEVQAPFEYKPWVELEFNNWGIRTIPWKYIQPNDYSQLIMQLKQGPIVIRKMQSAGGAGMRLVSDVDELKTCLPDFKDKIICVSPYLKPNIPINIGACVFNGGEITLHSPSIQLIGIPGLTSKRFGYCGNDFAEIRELDMNIVKKIEVVMKQIGKWLSSKGYLGAFGVDAIIYSGLVYITEINPRFQGSSYLSAQIDIEMERSNIYYEHIATFLGLLPEKPTDLISLVQSQPKYSQIIAHNYNGYTIKLDVDDAFDLSSLSLMLIPESDIVIDPEGILYRLVVENTVTNDGSSLKAQYKQKIETINTRISLNRVNS